ncbi:MAG: mechanosensitive ion channel family protein [Spirochaetaceae bacterium]|jgi:miniconductance mechanosensitive channel|nr:mechanosensitive ion channel family protein [Spirochaetaceae bacterium]
MNAILQSFLAGIYRQAGFSEAQQYAADHVVALIILAVVIFVIGKISSVIFQKALPRIFGRTIWTEALAQSGFLRRTARIAPAIMVYLLVPVSLPGDGWLIKIVERGSLAFIAGMSSHIMAGFLDTVQSVYRAGLEDAAKRTPIKGYIQLVKIFLYIIGTVLVITSLMDVSPVGILSGIGALSAVLMLVFKDLIVGFISGIHLSSNDMVRIGDIIDMPKFGADGSVMDITLQSVVIRNWDMSITTVPIYSFVSDSFKNWRGLAASAGRRVKRSIYIDMRSIHFLSNDEAENLSRIPLLSGYMHRKLNEINGCGPEDGMRQDDFISGPRLTNIGAFRAYIEAYLKSLPVIAQNMPFVVRELQPESTGIPLELYFFCSDKVWENYEHIQADIFDHLLAVIKEFGLSVCQIPGGPDPRFLAGQLPFTNFLPDKKNE